MALQQQITHAQDAPWAAQLVATAEALGGPTLALDTSAEMGCLALAIPDAARHVHEVCLPSQALPSEAMVQALQATLAAERIQPQALRALVVGVGPGSFTGLRVGLATLKGLSFGTGAPLYGSSSLAMLACGYGPGAVAIVRDARRGHVYVGGYRVQGDGGCRAFLADARLPVAEAQARLRQAWLDAQAADPTSDNVTLRFGGEGAELVAPGEALPTPSPRALWLLHHADARLRTGRGDALCSLAPAYLGSGP